MKIEVPILPIEQLRGLTPEELFRMANQGVKLGKRTDEITTAHKLSFPAMGKIVCVVEEHLNLLKSDRDENGQPKKRQLPANTSLAEYWQATVTRSKDNHGKLNPHWYSCAVTFGTYVRMELITEADYDKNTAECLELAASIAKEAGYDIAHDAVLKTAAELKDRSNKSRNNLKAILEGLKGTKPITAEKAREMLTAILAADPNFLNTVVIPLVGAEIAHIQTEEIARAAYFGLDTAIGMFTSNVTETGDRRFTDEMMDAWTATKTAANAPVQHLKAGEPVDEAIAA